MLTQHQKYYSAKLNKMNEVQNIKNIKHLNYSQIPRFFYQVLIDKATKTMIKE